MSIKSVADFTHLKPNILNDYYKNHLSDYPTWNQRKHAEEYVLYGHNLGEHLAIDETSLSNGELYTILTNKDGHGRRGTLVAMVEGVKSEDVIKRLMRLPAGKRAKVKSVTMDMSNSMYKIVRQCFPHAEQIVDRFHVQKLMYDALQDLRIRHRWEVMAQENKLRQEYKEKGLKYEPEVLPNGDTMRQLMVRCAHLLTRKPNDWSPSQRQRAEILFERVPDLKEFYYLALRLGKIYTDYDNQGVARVKLALWFNQVEAWHYEEFDTVIKTLANHHDRILNFFNDKRTNASAEAFNSKLKHFRTEFRGVNELSFYLYRVKQLFA